MNILLITTRLNLGGIGVYTSSLAKALKSRGNNVLVASCGGPLAETLKRDNIEHIDIPVDTSADIGLHTPVSYFRLSRVIEERGIDILHAQTRVTQVISSLLANRHKTACVTTCHGFFKRRWSRRLFPCWGMRVVAISDAVQEHLLNDMKVPRDKVRLVYNGVDIKKFAKVCSDGEKAIIRKEYGLKDAVTIGMISRLSEGKGHRYLLGAFARLLPRFKDLQLLIIGDGPAGYLKGLKEKARALSIDKSVVFRPACEDTSRPLSVIDVFCLPTLQEGLGLSILEAMASGIPVVASGVGGIYTLIKHGDNGFLAPPADEGALAEALSVVLSDRALAEEMGRSSKKLVEDNFTLDITADKVVKVYEEVLSKKAVSS